MYKFNLISSIIVSMGVSSCAFICLDTHQKQVANTNEDKNKFIVKIIDDNNNLVKGLEIPIEQNLSKYILKMSSRASDDSRWDYPTSAYVLPCQFHINGHVYRWYGFARLHDSDCNSFNLPYFFDINTLNIDNDKGFSHVCRFMKPRMRNLPKAKVNMVILVTEYKKLISNWTLKVNRRNR